MSAHTPCISTTTLPVRLRNHWVGIARPTLPALPNWTHESTPEPRMARWVTTVRVLEELGMPVKELVEPARLTDGERDTHAPARSLSLQPEEAG